MSRIYHILTASILVQALALVHAAGQGAGPHAGNATGNAAASAPVAGSAAGTAAGRPAAAAPASALWAPLVEPAEARAVAAAYERQMALGDSFAEEASQLGDSWVILRKRAMRAVAAYEKAASLRPDAAEPHYRAAEVLHSHFLERTSAGAVLRERALAERALAHWRAFEERAPLDPRATDTLFRRAIVNTRLAEEADLQRAIDNYETLIERSDLPSRYAQNVAVWLSNLAETYMMVGRLDDAVIMYQRALDYGSDALHGYGLAVALDRNQQGALAREVMLSYAMADRLRALEADGIFFVPEGEKDYYLGLGYEVLGDPARAALHYRRFIDSGAHPRYRPRAHENLRAALERLAKEPPRGARSGQGTRRSLPWQEIEVGTPP